MPKILTDKQFNQLTSRLSRMADDFAWVTAFLREAEKTRSQDNTPLIDDGEEE